MNLIGIRDVNVNGMVNISMNMDGRGTFVRQYRIDVGRRACNDVFNETEREKEHVMTKLCLRK